MAAGQTLPAAARDYFATQSREADSAIRAMRRQWSRLEPAQVVESYDALQPQLLAVVLTAQGRMAAPVAGYTQDVLTETGVPTDRIATTRPRALVGSAGDGRSIEGLLDIAPGKTLDAIKAGAGSVVALKAGQDFLDLAVTTALWDTARQAEVLEQATYPGIEGYVRMLNPGIHGACSRCVTLAGREYRKNDGFRRHPRCRCVHIPISEATSDDFRLDPGAYFDSLSPEDQDRIFTKAGAEVIREGADIGQVVNARRGMHTAQVNKRGWTPKGRLTPVDRYGRQVYITSESSTVRGLANRRRRGRRSDRLMPESIVELAEDRDDLLRLLKLHGYIG